MNGTPDQLARLAQDALAQGSEEEAEPRLAAYLERNRRDVRIMHWRALLLRSLDRRTPAIEILSTAQRLDPANSAIAHSLAVVSQEAGHPAAARFAAALRLAPTNPEILLGATSARFAEGDGAGAFADLQVRLAANPGWYQGHRQYAQLAAMLGQSENALASIDRALAAHPGSGELHLLAIGLLLEAEEPAAALAATDRAIGQLGEAPALRLHRAAALDELGQTQAAMRLFDRLGPAGDIGHAVRRLRHLFRLGQIERAAEELEPWLKSSDAPLVWPYAALAWRAIGDLRAEWLEGDGNLIKVIDFSPAEIDLPALADLLRSLHARAGRFLDQSVRHGTQTDGPLLARTDAPIARLREKLRSIVAEYCANLPRFGPDHPMASQKQDIRPRFAGSWSVRLEGSGFHDSHHHPQGRISSAFYVSVPEGLTGDQGRLVLGASPANLGQTLAPRMLVAPKPGRLVLFPSTMWHGTMPFEQGERMTVAFDIARA